MRSTLNPPSQSQGRVTAVLGPTNTGKTHLAIERMLGHTSGMIGFPLRLLARENYDRIVRVKGPRNVALITGEERIMPPNPSWFVCTVESMPLERSVAFLAIDEIQLAADPERGHIFTHRLRHARGRDETMFLGSDTIRQLLRRLVPDAEIVSRPRFSTLTYVGPQKVTRLPPRSAVVAFSVADVFELAELVRRQRGGTAVVLGALSPRARNAQVAMFEAGEVDYMVATDAIGMGLNMDLNHVAFARLAKFDGRGPRRLTSAEIAQIAGRAGRHMNDGTFGTTAELGPMPEEIVSAVETHRFDPLTALWWRNEKLDFRSGALLLKSLEIPPPSPVLLRTAEADDHQALAALIKQQDIAAIATNPATVRLLWEVCRIPDFRKVMSEHHSRLLSQIYRFLTGPDERLPKDWVARQLGGLERSNGDIDTLVQRIAHIRTWTYITNRPGWITDALHWQERARMIEDRLSDALHDRITQRFVDRRSAILVKHLNDPRKLVGAVSDEGEIRVEGQYVGTMAGFRFLPDQAASSGVLATLMTAANRVLREEVEKRARRLIADDSMAFSLMPDGAIVWNGTAIGMLLGGDTLLNPRVELSGAEFLEGALRDGVRKKLQEFTRHTIAYTLRPLGVDADHLSPPARGVLFRLAEGLGTSDARTATGLTKSLTPADRQALNRLGVRFGIETIYVEGLLKPAAVRMRAALWSVAKGIAAPELPLPGRLSVSSDTWDKEIRQRFGDIIGYRVIATRAIRVDRLEQLAAELRKATKSGAVPLSGFLAAIGGIPLKELPDVAVGLGYRIDHEDGKTMIAAGARRSSKRRKARRQAQHPALEQNPFSKLRELALI